MKEIFDSGRGVRLFAVDERVRALSNGAVIVDTTNAILLVEGSRPPVYYVPKADVAGDLIATDRTTSCGVKGEANYYSLRLSDGRAFDNAVWQYANPKDGLDALAGHVAIYDNVVDRWVEGNADAA